MEKVEGNTREAEGDGSLGFHQCGEKGEMLGIDEST